MGEGEGHPPSSYHSSPVCLRQHPEVAVYFVLFCSERSAQGRPARAWGEPHRGWKMTHRLLELVPCRGLSAVMTTRRGNCPATYQQKLPLRTSKLSAEYEECKNSDGETRQPGSKNEQTSSDLTSIVRRVESVTAVCQHACDSGSNAVTSSSGEPFKAKEHVYCTVYCIENDRHQARAESTDRRGDATEIDLETGQVASPSPEPEPELYSLDDLVDPFEDISQWLYREQVEAGTLMQNCRVCLEEKSIASLPCCGKAVCDACLNLYVSSQVGGTAQVCTAVCMDGALQHISHRPHYKLQSSQYCQTCTHAEKLMICVDSIHIQRTEGCDHMTCAQCNTNFCYRCGERYRHLRFFGNHASNLSVFGCKYRYLPDKPHLRRLIRGSVCGKLQNPLKNTCFLFCYFVLYCFTSHGAKICTKIALFPLSLSSVTQTPQQAAFN
uniref:RBR-type E3 ubiquitin transferase n=1 Tax=Oryzias sinensis TaxID=183150 RepID=A0A8C8E149_9TELE